MAELPRRTGPAGGSPGRSASLATAAEALRATRRTAHLGAAPPTSVQYAGETGRKLFYRTPQDSSLFVAKHRKGKSVGDSEPEHHGDEDGSEPHEEMHHATASSGAEHHLEPVHHGKEELVPHPHPSPPLPKPIVLRGEGGRVRSGVFLGLVETPSKPPLSSVTRAKSKSYFRPSPRVPSSSSSSPGLIFRVGGAAATHDPARPVPIPRARYFIFS